MDFSLQGIATAWKAIDFGSWMTMSQQSILASRRLTIATEMKISLWSVRSIVPEDPQFRKVCVRRVPHSLTAEHKASCSSCFVTTGEAMTFVYKTVSLGPSFHSWNKTKFTLNDLPLYRFHQQRIWCWLFFLGQSKFSAVMPRGTRWMQLWNLEQTKKGRRPGNLSEVLCFFHESAAPHSAHFRRDQRQRFKREEWVHPPYSPDIVIYKCSVPWKTLLPYSESEWMKWKMQSRSQTVMRK